MRSKDRMQLSMSSSCGSLLNSGFSGLGRQKSGTQFSQAVQGRWCSEKEIRKAEMAMVDGAYNRYSGSEDVTESAQMST